MDTKYRDYILNADVETWKDFHITDPSREEATGRWCIPTSKCQKLGIPFFIGINKPLNKQ